MPAARAKLVAVFLAEASCSHLLMVDAEVEWLPDDIVRLIIHDRGQLSVGQAQKAGNIP